MHQENDSDPSEFVGVITVHPYQRMWHWSARRFSDLFRNLQQHDARFIIGAAALASALLLMAAGVTGQMGDKRALSSTLFEFGRINPPLLVAIWLLYSQRRGSLIRVLLLLTTAVALAGALSGAFYVSTQKTVVSLPVNFVQILLLPIVQAFMVWRGPTG